MGAVSPHQLPVNFVQIIRFQNNRGNNAGALGGFHDNGDRSPEDVELRLDGWGVALLVDSEFGTIEAIVQGASRDLVGLIDRLGGVEVEGVVGAESGIIRTGGVHGIARGECLSKGSRQERRGSQKERKISHLVPF